MILPPIPSKGAARLQVYNYDFGLRLVNEASTVSPLCVVFNRGVGPMLSNESGGQHSDEQHVDLYYTILFRTNA